MVEITVNDFLKLCHPNVIDIRSREKFNDNHIPGALNINANLLLTDPSKYLNLDTVYYIYCQKGISSRTLAQILMMKGYKVYSIIGGYEAWLLNF